MRSTLCLSRTGLWSSLSHCTISWHSGILLPDLNLSASSLEIWVRVHQYQCIFTLLVHASLTVGKESGVILHPSSVTKPFTGIFRVISFRPNLIPMVASCVAKRPKYSLTTCNRKWSLHQSITLLGMWVMYLILHIKILRDDKVVSPVIRLLHSEIQMCTVGSWCPLFPSDSKPRKVAQLYATKGAVCGKHSSIHLSEIVREFLLRASGGDKAEVRGQCCLIFLVRTMLYFQRHWFCKLAGCWKPEYRAEEIWTLGKLKLPWETRSDCDPALSHSRWEAVFGNMKSQSIPLPLKWASFSWNCELCLSYHFYSTNVAYKMQCIILTRCTWQCQCIWHYNCFSNKCICLPVIFVSLCVWTAISWQSGLIWTATSLQSGLVFNSFLSISDLSSSSSSFSLSDIWERKTFIQ